MPRKPRRTALQAAKDALFGEAATPAGSPLAPAAPQPAPSEAEEARRRIYEDIFTRWLAHPALTDAQMVEYVEQTYGRAHRTALADVADSKSLLGCVQNAGREWHRYAFLELVRATYQQAQEKKNLDAQLRCLALMARYTQLDKPEVDAMDWDSLALPNFEPTTDVTVLGLTPIKNPRAVRARLERELGLTGAPAPKNAPLAPPAESPRGDPA